MVQSSLTVSPSLVMTAIESSPFFWPSSVMLDMV